MKVKGKRRTVWWLLAIVVLGLAIWGWRILNAPLPNYQTLVVRKGGSSAERAGHWQTGCPAKS